MNRRALAVLLVLLTTSVARAETSACPTAEATALAKELGLPAPDWVAGSSGVFLRFQGDNDRARATVWLARGADDRHLISSSLLGPGAPPAWQAALRLLISGLEPALKGPACLGGPPSPEEAAAIADQLSASEAAAGPTGDVNEATARLAHWVPRCIALAFAAYVGLVLFGFARGLRARPRRALVIVALAAGSFALRWLVAPRLTMVAAQADLGPVDVALTWLYGHWDWAAGEYPPFVATVLATLFQSLGPSLDLAFLSNAALGSLLPVAAFMLAEGLDPTRRAALPAGLAAATLPLAIWFSNGISLETPAALFATASLAHLLAWNTTRRTADLAAAALAAVLFLQCRPEAFVQASVLGVGLVAVFAHSGGFTFARPRPAGILSLATAALLATPFLVTVVPYYVLTLTDRPRQGMPLVGAIAAALCLFAWLWPRVRARASRVGPGARALVVLVLALAVATNLVLRVLDDSMRVVDASKPFVPVQWWLGTLRSLFENEGSASVAFVLDERWFPGALTVAAVLSLLPSRGARRSDAAVVGSASALAFVAVVVAVALSFSVSGEVLLQGLRYQVPALGMAAALAGVGFARVGEHLDRLPVRPGVIRAALLAVAALPALTHLDVTTNVWQDSQREFVFVREAVTRLPERAVVLVTDHPYRTEGSSPTPPPIDAIFRSRTFVRALARLAHRDVDVRGLTEWLAADVATTRPVFFLRELDCYRTDDDSGVEPACETLRATIRGAPLARTEFPHRHFGVTLLSRTQRSPTMIELELVPLSPAEIGALRERLAAPHP